MTKLGAFALALLFLVANGVFGGPGSTGTPAAAAQPLTEQPEWLRLDLTELSPRVVTPEADTLTVRATLTNVGDREITDIVARLQLGARQSSADELGRTLSEPPPSDAASSEWTSLRSLEPGASTQLTLQVPVAEFPLSAPGVYPLLVNVNGTPSYGGAARLAAANLLLPVIEPPAKTPPAEMSMLWPIAASRPYVVGAPFRGPVLLSDNGLAEELQPGGRLDTLVSAASAKREDPGVFGSLCFAIDPDLIATVDAMSRGYEVRTPEGPVPGSARADAARWLDAMRALVAGHCVVQIPYAGADLSALPRVDTPADLMAEAVDGTVIEEVLGVQPQQGVLWPTRTVDTAATRGAAGAGITTLITHPTDTAAVEAGGAEALAYDPLVASAFAAPGGAGPAQPNVATQNGLAAIAFRAGLGEDVSEEPLLVAPPHTWSAPVSELVSLLDSLSLLHAAGMLEPAAIGDLLAEPDGDAPAGEAADDAENTDDLAAGDETPAPRGALVRALSSVEATATDLRRAMSIDATRQVRPNTLIQPLHEAVLRATSAWWHDDAARFGAVRAAEEQLDWLRGQVTVETPSQPVSLASGSSPLPVTVTNSLPVAITVRLRLDNAVGLRPARLGDERLASGISRGILVPAEALRSGRFNVDVSLETPGGTKLGQNAHLELTSSEFGSVMVVITATAGAALVLLAGRRIYRRVRDARRGGNSQ